MSDGHDLLEGGGAPVHKYPAPGASLEGVIVEYSQRNQTKPDGTPELWPDGRPKREAVVTVLLDNGERARDFVRGNKLHGLKMAWAALSGVETPVGLRIRIERIADRPTSVPGHSPAHQFTVSLTRPSSDTNPDDLA